MARHKARAAKQAAKRGIEYLERLPHAVPEGSFLVHNTVQPTQRLGSRGFRAWLERSDATIEPCSCSWAAELGPHYRKRLAA